MQGRYQTTGYTLIELLLYVGIIGFILTAVVSFFGLAVDSRVKNQSITEVNTQGAFVLDYITQTVRNGKSINTPVVGTPNTQLSVEVQTAALTPTVFSVSGGVLSVKEGSGAAIALTNSEVQVTSFTTTNLTRSGTSAIVRINFVLARTNPANVNRYEYQEAFMTTVGVRQ